MRFGILGPFEVADDEGRELALGGRKQRSVLAILLLHAGEVVSSDRLSDELWGERMPATAAKTVRVYVSNLRKALGDGVLVTRSGGYALHVAAAEEVDSRQFEALAAEGRSALHTGDFHRAAGVLREALELWRGPALADFGYESFAQAEVARLEESRLAVLEDRIDADLALGAHTALVGELEALAREHPLRERLVGQLMLALYRSGRQADALETYRRTRTHLASELGLEPGPALKVLQGQILEQDPALDTASQLRVATEALTEKVGLAESRPSGVSLVRPLQSPDPGDAAGGPERGDVTCARVARRPRGAAANAVGPGRRRQDTARTRGCGCGG
jgi:DNA-binding SARP family transcriptional activator